MPGMPNREGDRPVRSRMQLERESEVDEVHLASRSDDLYTWESRLERVSAIAQASQSRDHACGSILTDSLASEYTHGFAV